MSEELSYLGSTSSLADIQLQSEEVTAKEHCNKYFNLFCQARRVKNKGALMTLLWNYLVASVLIFCIDVLTKSENNLVISIVVVAIGLTLPLVGLLADVRFGRYKIISYSLWIMWISSILMTVTFVVGYLSHIEHKNIIIIVLNTLLGIGWAGFQANIIQFGIDQLTDSSALESQSFVVWLTWTIFVAQLVLYYMLQCVKYELFAPLLICCNLTLALTLNISLNHVLIKEPSTRNPLKLVYGVISYAIKNKCPRQRSAFTYCEDVIPSRIDFGKSKYGGPFTTEQVEDVKTLLRIILVILVGCAVYSVTNEMHIYATSTITSIIFWSDVPDQQLGSCSLEFLTRGFYFICGTILIPLHEIILYPLCKRLRSLNVKIFHKFAVGAIFRLGQLVALLLMITYSRKKYTKTSIGFSNGTLPCLFHGHPSFLSEYIDHRWSILTEFMYAISDLMIVVAFLEFLCAQVPYSMKGLVTGIGYTVLAIYIPAFSAIRQIFEKQSLTWGTGVISCGFWYIMTKICLLTVAILIFYVVGKCYKNRKREDVLPNEHIFAERYYSQN